MVTLQDVANAAGVHKSAVSYALTGKGNLSAETRERIIRCAREMGYRPNLVAQNLRRQRTQTIGLLVMDIANPYCGTAAQVVERMAYRTGYRVMIMSTDGDASLGRKLCADLAGSQVDGIIAMSGGLAAEEIARILAPIPVVWYLWERETPDLAPAIRLDFRQAGRVVADYLLSLGHRRVGLITHETTPQAVGGRDIGFLERLEQAANSVNVTRVGGHGTIESGYTAALGLLTTPEPPTAIFATNDLMALGVLRAARQAGLQIPRNLSVVGFDDIFVCEFTDPPLTTLHIATELLMERAMQLLFDLLEGHSSEHVAPFLPQLIVRGSSGPAPAY